MVGQNMLSTLFSKLIGMWDSPNWNADGTYDGQGSGHNFEGNVSFLSSGLHVSRLLTEHCPGVASGPRWRGERRRWPHPQRR